jgi:SOS-response transcriptional repressor LexA
MFGGKYHNRERTKEHPAPIVGCGVFAFLKRSDAMMSEVQRRTLVMIQICLVVRGIAPSFEELRKLAGLSSKSGVAKALEHLQEQGYVLRGLNKPRSTRVLTPVELTPSEKVLQEKMQAAEMAKTQARLAELGLA